MKLIQIKRSYFGVALLFASGFVTPAIATPFFFSNGNVNGQMAVASRPNSAGKIEIEAADDFVIASQTQITNATFTGLITSGVAAPTVGEIVVEIYRVFPKDSTNPPSGNVPTRVNSPSDVAFASQGCQSRGLPIHRKPGGLRH